MGQGHVMSKDDQDAPRLKGHPDRDRRQRASATEFDSMGTIEVPADRYWGAQTQRSLMHFSIGNDRMPKEVYHAYGYVKKAAALVNAAAGRLPDWKTRGRSSRPPTRPSTDRSTPTSRSMCGRPGRAPRAT